jgi:transcription-repair coupling factor (superfamily II helicase)
MITSIQQLAEYEQLIEDIRAGVRLPGLGLPRSARLPIISAIYETLNWPIVLVVERMDQALRFADELSFWMSSKSVQLFPEPTPMFYENASWGSLARRDRLQSLTILSNYHLPGVEKKKKAPILITTVRGLMTRTLPRRDFLKSIRIIKLEQEIQPDFLTREWVGWGYEAVEIVVEPGQFSRRGGLLDIWSVAEDYPIRLDFFGDEIDSIRKFDPATQRTIKHLDNITISPASEVLPSKAEAAGVGTIELNEFSLPLIHRQPASLLDYLPRQALVVLEDSDLLANVANEIEEQAVRFRNESIREGIFDSNFPIPYQSWSEIIDILGSKQVLELGYSNIDEPSELALSFIPGERFGGKLKPFINYLTDHCNQGDRIWIVSKQIERIRELWNGKECLDQEPVFIDGSLSDGWVLSNDELSRKIYLFTDGEIFGWDRPAPRKRIRPTVVAPEAAYSDLKTGDWVVHIDFGIGRYTGLVQRVLDGVAREFLCVEYGHQDQLFVPVHQADRLGRYIGPDGSDPTPTRLGTQEWAHAKTKVREAVQEIAKELLELYALRSVAKGTQFSPDVTWQKELENSFPYVETEDQIRAIEEVKLDMESPRPMDRLLCGDVGYGKTEVALRAAFKAVMDGKQVAVLVPTTVLAQQHYETFKERLSPYPVKVEMLSRFRTSKEQDDILIKLILGEIDIIIGTHRLIQKDVAFKDIGLVIIDEEQRFGVTHKEFFKKMRTELDVLTLTATPIPRTLYMALTGVRDISMINTPPAERQPVVTHIGPYSQRLVRQAIIREIDRGGQIFFVHNRVQTINSMKMHLNNLVPEARVAIGHGQMHENELSKVMQDFTNHEIDVLLCTTIIESGLDIPNANTLIVDRGDAFGLAQLYQLRGRVGRGAMRAYAYFFRHRKKPPTHEGQERLETIAEYSQLGSGYSIAMRDLEMRGAGELLGTRQHGAIASVGFHLYTRLLAQAVRSLKNNEKTNGQEQFPAFKDVTMAVTVDLPINISIPMDYVSEKRMRLSLYRRIAAIETSEQIEEIKNEFTDRFGKIPDEMENLFFQIQVKQLAEKAEMTSVSMEGEQLVLRFPPLIEGMNKRNLPNIGPYVRTGKNGYWLAIRQYSGDWKPFLIQTLIEIINLITI